MTSLTSSWRHLGRALLHQRPDSSDDFSRPCGIPDDISQRIPHFGKIGRLLGKPAVCRVSICNDCSDRLIHFVCDGRDKFSDGCHSRQVNQFRVGAFKGIGSTFVFGDIAKQIVEGHLLPVGGNWYGNF